VDGVAAAWAQVTARVHAAALRAGRDPASVRIVAATKTVPAERIRALLAAGCTDLGENRAQELLAKAPLLAAGPQPAPVWHFIGPLQRNKVKVLAPWVGWWQTLDRHALVPVLAAHAPGATVLVEVNLAREPQKAGCDPDEVEPLVEAAIAAGLHVAGLMAIPPVGDDPRPWFRRLAAQAAALGLPECSMGMSDDFEIAVEEGATIVRLGRVLFGERPGVHGAAAPRG
jgi:pyridoxal phosphate enzyme (YggS family)